MEEPYFLDEVADLPQHMQVKLLRAIQERAVRPIGTQTEIPVDVRILSATHKDLPKLVEQADFRQDLFYRLNVIELRMPNLRERSDDIPELATIILKKLGENLSLRPPKFTPQALNALQNHPFPGNVRELENILERAFTLCEGDIIEPDDLQLPSLTSPVTSTITAHVESSADTSTSVSSEVSVSANGSTTTHIPPPTETGLENYLEELEKEAIMKALEEDALQ